MKIWTIEAIMSNDKCPQHYYRKDFGLFKKYCWLNKNMVCDKKKCKLKVSKK